MPNYLMVSNQSFLFDRNVVFRIRWIVEAMRWTCCLGQSRLCLRVAHSIGSILFRLIITNLGRPKWQLIALVELSAAWTMTSQWEPQGQTRLKSRRRIWSSATSTCSTRCSPWTCRRPIVEELMVAYTLQGEDPRGIIQHSLLIMRKHNETNQVSSGLMKIAPSKASGAKTPGASKSKWSGRSKKTPSTAIDKRSMALKISSKKWARKSRHPDNRTWRVSKTSARKRCSNCNKRVHFRKRCSSGSYLAITSLWIRI